MNNTSTVFNPPRQAQIVEEKYVLYGTTLKQMGLHGQNFRAVGMNKDQVFVHPSDGVTPEGGPLALRGDMVKFKD